MNVLLQNNIRLSFSSNNFKYTKIFELLHIDIWKPYKVPIHKEYKYFLTIVDSYSKVTWTLFMRNKSNTFQLFKNITIGAMNQFEITIKKIISDNGSEFTSQIFINTRNPTSTKLTLHTMTKLYDGKET